MQFNALRGTSGTFWAELVTTVYYCVFIHLYWGRLSEAWNIFDTPVILLGVLYVAKIWLMAWMQNRGAETWDFGHSKTLVTIGPYRLTRNPVYTIVLIQLVLWLFSVAEVMMQQDVWTDETTHPVCWIIGAIISFAWFWFYADRRAIPREERNLAADHPVAYPEYCRKVSRWGVRFRLGYSLARAWD